MRRVSVIVVNWNGRHLLEACFQALKEQTYCDFEVIAVDNGSEDGSVDFLKTYRWSRLKTLFLNENRGFAGGNNAALPLVTGDTVALLNNDARPEKNWIKRAVERMEKDQVDMIACRILKADGLTIDKVGHLIYLDGLNRGYGTGQRDGEAFSQPAEALWPDGCAAFYSKNLVDSIGFFDDDFYLYGEDADLGFRARRAGFKCMYEPESKVIHLQSASLGKFNPDKLFYVERNRIYLLLKNFPLTWIVLSPWFTLKRYLMNMYSMFSGQGAAAGFKREQPAFKLGIILIKATLAGAFGSVKMLLKRKHHKGQMTSRQIKQLLKAYSISARELTLQD
ncbi:MAG: hypothetical protein CR997_01990 [Acidobacteria bacterium]|nr:MAG: hypothetical protein CR997_01990 [Acidobacteriota bacterium]